MKEVKIERCPYCGGEKLITCRVKSYGSVWIEGSRHASVLDHALICCECGSVVRAYIQIPETLFSETDRKKD